VRVPRIRFNWSRDHLKHEPTMYRFSYDKLTERNKDSFAKLVEFVNSFSRSVVVDDGGNPVMDLQGNPVTKPRLIDTRSLVFSRNSLALLSMLALLFPSSAHLSFLITDLPLFLTCRRNVSHSLPSEQGQPKSCWAR
jgi:hypothetical protein